MHGKRLINKQRCSINVCFLIDISPEKFTGGGQVHLVNLMREVQIQSSKFKVQSFGGPSPHVFTRLLWTIWVIPQVFFYHVFRKKFTLIHAHSIPAMISGKILSVVLHIPIVVTIHGAWMKSLLEKFVLTQVQYDAQITVSRDFLRHQNVNKEVFYVPNGVDIEKYKKVQKSTEKYRNEIVVLFVGRKHDPVKGFKILQHALSIVKRKFPNVRLLVADGSVSPDEVRQMYKISDLLVLPSLSEGFPLTLLEAWAAKLPVVATAVGETQYLVKDGKNGYLAKPEDHRSLAHALMKALKNPKLAKLGENGYNLAKTYTWQNVARETLLLYRRIC